MKLKLLYIPLLIVLISTATVYSMSNIEKTQRDYRFSLATLRNIKVMVENFPEEGTKAKFEDIQTKFQEASESFYGRKYDESLMKFKNVKDELSKLMQQLAKNYLTRSKEILDSTSKDAFNIIIKYGKNSGEMTYFRKPFDPLHDVKAYNEKNYHFYHDKGKIQSHLNEGYRRYQDALNIYNDPEIEYIRKKKVMPSEGYNFIIDRYYSSILLCREAKQFGIEIHKIGIKQEELKDQKNRIMQIHTSTSSKLPIFDERIPDKYKVDANDNLELIHSIEMQRANIKEQSKSGQEPEKK